MSLNLIRELDVGIFLISAVTGIKIHEIYFKVETLGSLSTVRGLNSNIWDFPDVETRLHSPRSQRPPQHGELRNASLLNV